MSDSETNEPTHHGLLVAWGEFAQSVGPIQEIESLPLRQKTVTHRPQAKILEFLVAILAGPEYLKDWREGQCGPADRNGLQSSRCTT